MHASTCSACLLRFVSTPTRDVPVIVTVTLNPTLDKTLSVSALRPGEVHRARFLRQDIGGKGINVSRALRALGVASIPIGFLGGATGRAITRRAGRAGL